MKIRCLEDRDFPQLANIHREFYKDEFIFPELKDPKWLSKFVVTDEFDNVVVFGGNKILLEAIAITDKRRSVRERREALYKLLQAELFCCSVYNFDQLHAFIQDPVWAAHLKKNGFRACKGSALVIDAMGRD